MTETKEDRGSYFKDGFFYPPHAEPLKGDEGFIKATWTFLRNPVEGFGPMAYNQPIVSVPNFGKKLHVIVDPEGMMQVLSKESEKFTKTAIDARILGPATREGLLSVHGEQWKRQRRGVAPMFRKRHMVDLAPHITEVIKDFKSGLLLRPKVELSDAMADLTFNILAKALLGDPQGLDRDKLRRATRRAVTSAGTLRPDDLMPWPRWVPRPIGPRGQIALRLLKRAARKLLESRDDADPGDDLVGLLISAQDPVTGMPLSSKERLDNLIGFFIAGHETTALTLTWALYLCAMDKNTASRIREEVLAVCGEEDVTYEDLELLKFTRAVIDETMRLYPPAPMLNRECHEDTIIHDRQIKAGDTFLLCNYVMHRTERLWDNPLAFDPDRFLDSPELKSKGAPFMPFGAGPRICVGASFAIMEAMLVLSEIIREFDIRIPVDCYPKPLMTVTLRPEGPIAANFLTTKTAN